MLSAYLVRDIHKFLKGAILLCGATVLMSFKSPAVDAVGVIEHAMEMYMVLVDVAGHEILIFAFKELLAYLLTELQGSLWRDLTGLETDNKVLGENGAFARPVFPNLGKIMTCLQRIRAATFGDDQSAVIRFFRISNVVQCCKVISRD